MRSLAQTKSWGVDKGDFTISRDRRSEHIFPWRRTRFKECASDGRSKEYRDQPRPLQSQGTVTLRSACNSCRAARSVRQSPTTEPLAENLRRTNAPIGSVNGTGVDFIINPERLSTLTMNSTAAPRWGSK